MTTIGESQSSAVTALYSALASAANQQDQMDSMAKSAINNGITRYTNGDYEGAADEFKRAFSLSPQGDYASTTAEYMSKAYQQLGEYDKAVKAYQNIIKTNPTDADLKTKYGNLLYALDRTEDAEAQYRDAYRIDKSATSLFSLAQAQMANGKYTDAKGSFESIISMEPTASQGYYGLGQVLAKMEDYNGSVTALTEAVKLDDEFYDAWMELGYTYTDMGENEKADSVFNFLEEKGESDMADTLSRYMYQKSAPNIASVMSGSTFLFSLPPKTPVAALSSYLASPGANKTFTMEFMFDKEMDAGSVQSIYNWKIQRSDLSGPAASYNNGLSISATEVKIPVFPTSVIYDPDTLTAKVSFRINQLPTSINGTIDPSHILFQFSGKDTYGNPMDVNGDQYAYATGVR
jgi:Tfp pilus assembly protein PilF